MGQLTKRPAKVDRSQGVSPLFRVFPILWKLARVFLDAKTSKKCVVLKTSEIRKLCDYFNPEELPEEFGGTCSCEGGCLPPITKAMVRKRRYDQITGNLSYFEVVPGFPWPFLSSSFFFHAVVQVQFAIDVNLNACGFFQCSQMFCSHFSKKL